jgi:DNA (cytosine-5)-methyltransferase 1
VSDQVVALFSGAGGLSLGFSRAGLPPLFAADMDEDACSTYSTNLGTQAHPLDLGSDDTVGIRKLLVPYRNCFAVIGGPPCQGFSTAGTRRSNDPRNRLVFHYLDIVDYLNPRWFLFENVEGILTANGGESIYSLLACFIDRGYTVRLEKINFAAYGLPQSRKRVLVVGNRIGANFDLPAETHSFSSGKHKSIRPLPHSPSLMDAILDLPASSTSENRLAYPAIEPTAYGAAMRSGNTKGGVTHHYASANALDCERIGLLRPGQTMRDLPEEYWHPSFRRRAYRRVMDGTPTERRGGPPSGVKRLIGDKCALTITSAASREFIHPIEDRPLTLREAARLQSFPDWYEFQGSYSAIATQIGNAVPPLAAEILARHIANLDGSFGMVHPVAAEALPGLLGFRLTDSLGKSPALQRTEALLLSLPAASVAETGRLYGI